LTKLASDLQFQVAPETFCEVIHHEEAIQPRHRTNFVVDEKNQRVWRLQAICNAFQKEWAGREYDYGP